MRQPLCLAQPGPLLVPQHVAVFTGSLHTIENLTKVELGSMGLQAGCFLFLALLKFSKNLK